MEHILNAKRHAVKNTNLNKKLFFQSVNCSVLHPQLVNFHQKIV